MSGAGANNKPVVNPPFNGGTSYSTSVFAGDFVTFNISGTDNDIYSTGSAQDLTLEVSGGQFASDYTTTSLCFLVASDNAKFFFILKSSLSQTRPIFFTMSNFYQI